MENREYGGEEERVYPSEPSYSGQGGWRDGYENPYAVNWQSRPSVYGQATHDHHQTHAQAEFCASSYDGSSSNLRHADFTTDAADNRSSFYQFGQHTQPAYTYPHDPTFDASQVPGYCHHTQVSLDTARPYGHHSAAHVPPAAYTDHRTTPPQQQGVQQSTGVDKSTTSCSSSLTDYAGSFLAHVQKFVARHREAFDQLVEGQRGSEDEIHHNAHSSEMSE